MNNRIRATQKDVDNIKRKLESAVVSNGGSFCDTNTTGGILSIYIVGPRKQKYKWHRSYNDWRSLKNVACNAVKVCNALGIAGSKRDLGITCYLPSVGEDFSVKEFFE